MNGRYERNFPSLSEKDFRTLRGKTVCVIGCGGLGGFIIEYLARIGIGALTLVDGDAFEESNLNRQLYSHPALLGFPKAAVAAERVRLVNPDISVTDHVVFLNKSNAADLICGSDIVIDALDSADARIILAQACRQLQIPLVHGAVSGWNGQVALVLPGSRLIENLYAGQTGHDDQHSQDEGSDTEPESPSTLSFVPAHAAAIEVAEAVKYLCSIPSELTDHILFFDLQSAEYHLFDVKGLVS